MADQKISELTPVSTPTNTNELAVNESGTSKKLTVKQIQGGEVPGAIPFVDTTGVFVQDNSNLFWNAGSIHLGIGTNNPEGPLHIKTGSASVINPSSQADDLVIQNEGDVGMTMFSPDARVSSMVFGSPGGTGGEGARLRWANSLNLFTIATTEADAEIRFAPGFLNTTMTLKVVGGAGHVGIGISAPQASAKLDITSITQGFLPPRMTTTQRDNNIVSPAAGLMIYNSTTNKMNYFNGTVWRAMTDEAA